ncbi:MAG: hypothetical protein MO853_07750 [Candidatus Protistobacter heckmanni]|nr:hypothetical protein [Candidatus Protistobacter heckmanni]
MDGVLTADLPAHVQVTRAINPLQAQRLAQYAVYNVLRIQRDMAFFENLQRERKWVRPDAPQ